MFIYTPKGYSREISIAGLLHDAIEDTKITKEDIENNFGKEVAEIVQANTKDENLHGDDKWEQLIKQYIELGEDALVVKSADIIDNHIYYSRIHEREGVNYTTTVASLLLKIKPKEFKDPIFDELKKIVTKAQ